MYKIANNLLMCYKMEALGSYLDFVLPAYHTHKWAHSSLFQLPNGSNKSFFKKDLRVFYSYAFTDCMRSFSCWFVFGSVAHVRSSPGVQGMVSGGHCWPLDAVL